MEKELKKLDPAAGKPIPADLLKKISGGVETGDPAGTCPNCGADLQWLEHGNDCFVRYCTKCLCIWD